MGFEPPGPQGLLGMVKRLQRYVIPARGVRPTLASIDLNRLADEQLARISAGERALSVQDSPLDPGISAATRRAARAATCDHA